MLRFDQLRASHVKVLAKNPKSKPRHERINVEMFTKKKETSYVDVKKDSLGHVTVRSHVLDSSFKTSSQEIIWHSIPSYFAEHASAEAKKRCRNVSQKRKYIVEELKMPLQFDRGKGGKVNCWVSFAPPLSACEIISVSHIHWARPACKKIGNCLLAVDLLSTTLHYAMQDDAGEEGVAVDSRPKGQKLIVVGKTFAVEKERRETHDERDEQQQAFERLQSRMSQVNSVEQAGCLIGST